MTQTDNKLLEELLIGIVGEAGVLNSESDRRAYGKDTSKNYSGVARVVVRPKNSDEVQQIINACFAKRIPVVPSGGRTGLCGAAVANESEVVLSLERMNRILQVDPVNRWIQVEAGVTTQAVKDKAAEHELDLPISLASQGSSQIGGNISTNVGGIHVVRHGYIRQWVLSLEVVTGDGKILRTGRPLKKDNSGYDLRSLFVGSEGTLGIITSATIGLCPKPAHLTRVLCGLRSYEKLLPLLDLVDTGELEKQAFEFFTDRALKHVTKHRGLKNPLGEEYPVFAVVEYPLAFDDSAARLEPLFMQALEAGLIENVVIGQNSKQSEEIMALREWISETLTSHFTPYKNDISVPVSTIPAFCVELQEVFDKREPEFELVLFGHVADGNIHLNWLKPDGMSDEEFFSRSDALNAEAFELVAKYGGSISAEHGIGLLKRDKLHLTRSEIEIDYMRQIKKVFDPAGIMNPGKIFELK